MKKTFMDDEEIRLTEIHRKAAANFQDGLRDAENLVPRGDLEYLAGLGIPAQVLIDDVEDFVRYGEPDAATFVRVVEIRREYFRGVQHGVPGGRIVKETELPRKTDEWEGIPWLPRIAKKARCFLEGTLCSEVMYGCSGDRAFLKKFNLSLPGFLELVRDSGSDVAKIVRSVRGN